MFKNSPIPLWANILAVVLLLFMGIQVYWFFFDHAFLAEAGISTDTPANLNVVYSTASRLLAMMAITAFVLVTQNPYQYSLVLLMSVIREGQEMFIDPMFPYANAPSSPTVDLAIHVVIFALEITAFVVVFRRRHQSAGAPSIS